MQPKTNEASIGVVPGQAVEDNAFFDSVAHDYRKFARV